MTNKKIKVKLRKIIIENRKSRKGRNDMEKTMEKIVALAKSRGFVYPGSEIYGGLANTWDYGNLGVELKEQRKKGMVEEIYSGKPL